MNVLDDDTHRQVELYLETHPDAVEKLEQLRRGAEPLAWDEDGIDPPPNLVIGTLGLVAEHAANEKLRPKPKPEPVRPATTFRFPLWRRLDVLIAASLLLAVVGIGAPWLYEVQFLRNRKQCQDNLAEVYKGLRVYTDRHGGKFPSVKEVGDKKPDRAVAGLVVPMLISSGYIKKFWPHCPGSPEKKWKRIKYEHALYKLSDEEFEKQSDQFLPTYGYALGYRDENGQIHGPNFNHDKYNRQLALMADENSEHEFLKNSPNHLGRGQNILFQDGHVNFYTIPQSGFDGDNLYCNKYNKQEAGHGISDVVIGHSSSRP